MTPAGWLSRRGDGRHAAWAVTTRLEVQFQGRRRLPELEDPGPDEGEPEDPPAASAGAVAPGSAPR